jgi:hypothetical protein
MIRYQPKRATIIERILGDTYNRKRYCKGAGLLLLKYMVAAQGSGIMYRQSRDPEIKVVGKNEGPLNSQLVC